MESSTIDISCSTGHFVFFPVILFNLNAFSVFGGDKVLGLSFDVHLNVSEMIESQSNWCSSPPQN